MDDSALPSNTSNGINGRTAHRRSSSGGDPFQHPDIYYGNPESVERIKNRRRAFSSVCAIILGECNGRAWLIGTAK